MTDRPLSEIIKSNNDLILNSYIMLCEMYEIDYQLNKAFQDHYEHIALLVHNQQYNKAQEYISSIKFIV